MVFFFIFVGILSVIALFFLIFGEIERKKYDRPRWAYMGRIIAISLATTIIPCGILAFTLKPTESLPSEQSVVTQLVADGDFRLGGFVQSGHLEESLLDGTFKKSVYTYGLLPGVDIYNYEIERDMLAIGWQIVLLVLPFISIIVIGTFGTKKYREILLEEGSAPSWCLTACLMCAIVLLGIVMCRRSFTEKFPSQSFTIPSASMLFVDPDTPGHVLLIDDDGSTQWLYGATNLHEAFSSFNTFGRHFVLNYDETTDTLLGFAEIVEP